MLVRSLQRLAGPPCVRSVVSSTVAARPTEGLWVVNRALLSTKAAAPKKGGKKEGGGKDKKAGSDVPMPTSKDVVPVNFYKDGKDPPLLPDDQYPSWLFEMRPLTLPEYEKLDLNELPLKEQGRYWKLLNRQVIRMTKTKGQKL